MTATEDRAELLINTGQAATALASLIEIVRAHPFRERPVRLLMLAQHQAGRSAEALESFQQLRRRLADDLGLDPSPELLDLQTQILTNDPSLLPPDIQPIPTVELIGRDADQEGLIAVARRTRMVTVVGPGGVGKTSLVAAVAPTLGQRLADGAVLCELSRVPASTPLAVAICTTLQIPVTDQDPYLRLAAYLADRELLLILDDCEHRADEVAQLVSPLVRSCERLRVLATSRIPLKLPVETVFLLEPLAIRPDAAVQLFVTRAKQRVRDFVVDAVIMDQIAELCRRLDGLPLAIELAASRMDALTPADLLARLQWRLTVLRGGAGSEPRHRTLRAVVDWSFDRLSVAEQELFTIISVYAGPFRLDDVERLMEQLDPDRDPSDVILILSSLVEQSMITRPTGGDGYLLLETLRTYGREKLARGPFATSASHAHAIIHAESVSGGFDNLYGAGQPDRVRRLSSSMAELRAAYWWAAEHDQAMAAALVGGLAALVEQHLVGEIADWAEKLITALGDRRVTGIAGVYAVAAAGARFTGDLERARSLAGRSLELSVDDRAVAAYASYLLAEIALFTGDLDRVQAGHDQVALLAAGHDQLQSLLAITAVTALLAVNYRGDRDVTLEARALQARAERGGWPIVAAWALYVRGEVALDHHPAEAAPLLQEAMDRARQLDERYLAGVALVALASARARHGDPRQAVRTFTEVVHHWRDRGDWTHQWTTLRNVLDLLVRLDRAEAATVLAAALLDSGRAATGFGADAQRLTETARVLAANQDPARSAELSAQGRSLTDQEVVSFALHALADPA